MTHTPAPLPILYVSIDIIRQIFNDSQLAEKASNGELIIRIKRNSHLSEPAKIKEPYCTNSQIVYYYDADQKPLAVVHQYLRPDGTIGASGKPDPKQLVLPDKIIALKAPNQEDESK